MSENPIAGWYEDPTPGASRLRYWDGSQWTEQFQDIATSAGAAPMASSAESAYQTSVAPQNQTYDASSAYPTQSSQSYDYNQQSPYGQSAQPYGSQQQPYAQPMQTYAPQYNAAVPQTNGAAIGSLVCGIAGLLVFGFILGTIAIILGIQGRKLPVKQGMATAGIVLGAIDVVGWVIFLIFMFA